MNKIMIMLMLLVGISFAVEVPDSLLTDDQKAYVNQKSTQENVKGWIGIGNEIGTAVDASLKAITDRSNDFAQTPVGKLTIFLVVWKVMGTSVSAIIGIFVSTFIFGIWLFAVWRKMKVETDKDWKNAWITIFVGSFVVYFITVAICIVNIGQ